MPNATFALDRINTARNYTLENLQDVKDSEWFSMPGGITHVAWQMGHLAVAQFNLCLGRTRGRQPSDAKLLPEEFAKLFGKGSIPADNPSKYPAVAEIRRVFDGVHQQVQIEIAKLSDAELDQPPLQPYRLAKNKFESLLWCGYHETLHAGQISLVKRLLGHAMKA